MVRLLLALLLVLLPSALGAQTDDRRPLLRLSTENNAAHVQTRMVRVFADRLRERIGDRVRIEHHHGATLARDQDVVGAMERGLVEMAVPGTWQLDRFVPDVGVLMLPMFYGLDAETNHALRDGAVGERINRRIDELLDVVVVGRWIDLGFAHVYTTRAPLGADGDLRGLRIRFAGGRVNSARLEALNALPVLIPWPDLPAALEHGAVDGLLTTHETVASARLWERGVRHCVEDRQYYPQYIPIITKRFWARLSPDIRAEIARVWEDIVPMARSIAATSQTDARLTLERNGVAITSVPPSALAATRDRLILIQDELAASLGIDADLVRLTMEGIASRQPSEPP